MPDTRLTFFKELIELAAEDEKVVLLTGDLGYNFIEGYMERFPKQFINCGIAEQNMVGVAGGLARQGYKPFVYSGAMFLCTRALEQMRDDVCYPNLNVTFVGTGASGFLGFTHNFGEGESYRDLIQNLPNLVISEGEDMYFAVRRDGPNFIKL